MTAALIIELPGDLRNERTYAAEVVFRTMLGLDISLRFVDPASAAVRITMPGDARSLTLPDVFFREFARAPFKPRTLPLAPYPEFSLPPSLREYAYRPSLPVLYGKPVASGDYLDVRERGGELGLDVLGMAFVLLTRYEECVVLEADAHGRFPWQASFLSVAELYRRPLVDESVEVLEYALRSLWPSLPRARREYRLQLSHDVDRLFSVVGRSWPAAFRGAFGDVVVRKRPFAAAHRLLARAGATFGSWRLEPVNTFGYIMSASERLGIRSAFYFIPMSIDPRWDGDYDLEDPRVLRLMGAIQRRGHEIGLHASYGTLGNPAQLASEVARLREAAERTGARQEGGLGGRQHYLRWSAQGTWSHWDSAGMAYDSTVGFAERAGFRCGTCIPYPVFDLQARRPLGLAERPLIAMDVSLSSPEYMNLAPEGCFSAVSDLIAACRHFRGSFGLLWHNTSLVSRPERSLYERILRTAA